MLYIVVFALWLNSGKCKNKKWLKGYMEEMINVGGTQTNLKEINIDDEIWLIRIFGDEDDDQRL